jgi:hypothetical protein
LTANTTGSYNLALGNGSLLINTTGSRNLAFGYNLLPLNTTGTDNITMGYTCLSNNNTGTNNISIGNSCLITNTTGSHNIAIGKSCLYSNTIGTYNVGIGYQVLQNNTTGTYNVGIGYIALRYNTTGYENVGIGLYALTNNTTGYSNTGMGFYALRSNTTGSGNTGYGNSAGSNTRSGLYNTSIGNQALWQNTTGGYNVAIGVSALVQGLTGSNNVAVGNTALYNATGSFNTAVGLFAYYSGTYSNSSCFGNGSAVTASNQVQLGNSSTTTYVWGYVSNRSDMRDKTDIRDTELGSDFILSLRPVDFRWDYRDSYKPEKLDLFNEQEPERTEADTDASYMLKLSAYNIRKQNYDKELDEWSEAAKLKNITHDGTKKRNRFHHGFIAQEVANLRYQFGGYQNHIINGGDDVLTISYSEFIAPMVKTLQEFNRRLQILEQYMANNAPDEPELEPDNDDIFIDPN